MTDAVRSTLHEPSGKGGVTDLPALHAREIDRLVAYLFSSDRVLGATDAEAIAEQAFQDLKTTWPGTGGYPSHQVHLFAAAQRIASTRLRHPSASGVDPLKDSALSYWDRADVARLTVLQDGLDRLPDVPRRVVLLREMCGFSQAESALILSIPEPAVESARGDALRALVPVIEAGTASGQARRGPLVPEDFGALARVLQVGDGRVAAARGRFAASLGQPSGSPPGAGGVKPSPPTVAPTAPPTTALGGFGPRSSDVTRLFPAASSAGQPPAPQSPPAQPPVAQPASTSPSFGSAPLGPQAYTRPGPLPGAPLAPSPSSTAPRTSAPSPSAPSGQALPPAPPAPPQGDAPLRYGASPVPGQLAAPPAYTSSPTFSSSAPSPLDVDSPLGGSANNLVNIGTPIFDSVSAWFSSGGASEWASLDDAAWREASRRAASAPTVEGNTDVGLPRRRPGANTVPSASQATSRTSLFGAPSAQLDAGTVRSRLGGFQDGLRNARRMRDETSEPVAVEAAVPKDAVFDDGNIFEAPTRPGDQDDRPAPVTSARPLPFQASQPPAGSSSAPPRKGALPVRRPAGPPLSVPGNGEREGTIVHGSDGVAARPSEPVPVPGQGADREPAERAERKPVDADTSRDRMRRPPAAPQPTRSGQASPASAGSAAAGTVRRRPGMAKPPATWQAGRGPTSRSGAERGPVDPAGTRAEPAERGSVGTAGARAEPAERGPVDSASARAESAERPSEARGFSAFYRDYLPQLLALLMIEGARPALAAEIAQDVMSAAYREWARIDSPREWTRERALAEWGDRRDGNEAEGI